MIPINRPIAKAHDSAFVCAICERMQDDPYASVRRGPDRAIPPICRYCEGDFTRGKGRPHGGSFRDRREVMRIFALAEALLRAATTKQWSKQYGRS